MEQDYTSTLSPDRLTLKTSCVRKTPYILKVPTELRNSKLLKIVFWYVSESNSFKALAKSTKDGILNRFAFFFEFINNKEYLFELVRHDGELREDLFKIFNQYLIKSGESQSYRHRKKITLKGCLKAYSMEYPSYKTHDIWSPILDTFLKLSFSTPQSDAKRSTGAAIALIATLEEQKAFESNLWKAWFYHVPLQLNKLRQAALKLDYVQELLEELKERTKELNRDIFKEDAGYQKFIDGRNLQESSEEYREKAFKLFEAILSSDNELLIDCFYQSLQPKLFSDHEDWKDNPNVAPFKRQKTAKQTDKEWLTERKHCLEFFKRKRQLNRGNYAIDKKIQSKRITFSWHPFFCLKSLLTPTIEEVLGIAWMLGWHQIPEGFIKDMTLDYFYSYEDKTIRIHDAIKKRTGNSDAVRNIPVREFNSTSLEYKVFCTYRELLASTYLDYPALFTKEEINNNQLFFAASKTRFTTDDKRRSSFITGLFFEFVPTFSTSKTGIEAKAFYEKLTEYIVVSSIKHLNKDLRKKHFEELDKKLINDICFEDFMKIGFTSINPNTFRLSAQAHVHQYAAASGQGNILNNLNTIYDNDVQGARHAHTGKMDHQYFLRSRSPILVQSENIFGTQVSEEMVDKAKYLYGQLTAAAKYQFIDDLHNTTIWTLEDVREHLGIGTLEERYISEKSEITSYFNELLSKGDFEEYEGLCQQTIGLKDKKHGRFIVIDSPLTCFLMLKQIDYLDDNLEALLNKKITSTKSKPDLMVTRTIAMRAYLYTIVHEKFTETTRKKAYEILKSFDKLPPIPML